MPRIKSLSALQAQIRALQKRAATIEAKADKKITQLVSLIQRHGLSIGDWKRAVSLSKTRKRGGPRKGKRVPVKYADDKGNDDKQENRYVVLWNACATHAGSVKCDPTDGGSSCCPMCHAVEHAANAEPKKGLNFKPCSSGRLIPLC